MPTIAVGDIHGNLAALADALDQIRAEARAGDTVVFLGDYIDRGADSKGCVDAILEFKASCGAKVICLCGNHEDWMLATFRDHTNHSWLFAMDALPTIESYSHEAAQVIGEAAGEAGRRLIEPGFELPYGLFFDAMPRAHLELFENLKDSWETEDCISVHAGLDPNIRRLEDQPREALVWGAGRGRFPDEYTGDKYVVYGHRNNPRVDGLGWPMPRVVRKTIGLDTSHHGVVTAVCMPGATIIQSRRHMG